MLAVHAAFHLGAYHFAHGTFQPASTGTALGCAELDSLLGDEPSAGRTASRMIVHTARPAGHRTMDGLLGGGPRLADGNASADLNAALDVCFDAQFSCSHAEVHYSTANREGTNPNPNLSCGPEPQPLP